MCQRDTLDVALFRGKFNWNEEYVKVSNNTGVGQHSANEK